MEEWRKRRVKEFRDNKFEILNSLFGVLHSFLKVYEIIQMLNNEQGMLIFDF